MAAPPTPSHPITQRFESALAYAIAHHRDDIRKGTRIPYAAHLLAVAAIVMEMEGTEDEAIAALLHDVVEDGGGPRAAEEIRARFGSSVAAMVLANSDSTSGSRDKAPWRERKESYLAGIADKPISAVRVSIADKLHNARAILRDYERIGDVLWDRFSVGGTETLWYYGSLVAAFESRRPELGPGGEAALDDLARVVTDLSATASSAAPRR